MEMNDRSRQRLFSSVFSRAFLSELCDDSSAAFSHISDVLIRGVGIAPPCYVRLLDAYNYIYDDLVKAYRTEYVYKNAIAEKIVKGRHKLSSSCYYATEFRVGPSIADVVVANGTTSVYEIKTEYDSLERLCSQLDDYSKVFDRIHVVIPESKLAAWSGAIPHSVGVIYLTNNYSLKIERDAASNVQNIDAESVFSCLRRDEMIAATIDKFGELPNVSSVRLKSECKKMFNTLSSYDAHSVFLHALRSRGIDDLTRHVTKVGPSSLTSILLTSKLNKKQAEKLMCLFQEKYINLIHEDKRNVLPVFEGATV